MNSPYPLHTKGDAPDLCRIGGVALFTFSI